MNLENFKKCLIKSGSSDPFNESYHQETSLADLFNDIYKKYYSGLGNNKDFLSIVKMKSKGKPPMFYNLSENSTKTIRQVYKDFHVESFLFPSPTGNFLKHIFVFSSKFLVHIQVKNEEQEEEKAGFLMIQAACTKSFADVLKDVQDTGGPPDLLQKRRNDIEITVGPNIYSFHQVQSKQLYELIEQNFDTIIVNIRKKPCIVDFFYRYFNFLRQHIMDMFPCDILSLMFCRTSCLIGFPHLFWVQRRN